MPDVITVGSLRRFQRRGCSLGSQEFPAIGPPRPTYIPCLKIYQGWLWDRDFFRRTSTWILLRTRRFEISTVYLRAELIMFAAGCFSGQFLNHLSLPCLEFLPSCFRWSQTVPLRAWSSYPWVFLRIFAWFSMYEGKKNCVPYWVACHRHPRSKTYDITNTVRPRVLETGGFWPASRSLTGARKPRRRPASF